MRRSFLRRFLASRRGDWIQLFMIFFFIIILILSIALLTFDLDKLKSDRQQLGTDLLDQEANAQLINILRYQVENGKRSSLAETIVTNNGTKDQPIAQTLEQAIPPTYYFELDIAYPDGSQLIVSNTEYKQATKEMLRSKGPQALRDISRTERQSQVLPETLTTTVLPGPGSNIKVELFLSHKLGTDTAKMRSERLERGEQ